MNDDGYERLKKQIQDLGQYKPFIVMPESDHFIVLGGNMRLQIYQELGIAEVWCSRIEFVQEGDVWRSVINGKPSNRTFTTKENGMMEYALSDNDRAGYYDADKIINAMPTFQVDWSAYSLDFKPPETIQALIDQVERDADKAEAELTKEDKIRVPKKVTCPECNAEFEV
jgi:hypothetical protein